MQATNRAKPESSNTEIPEVIGMRVGELRPLLTKWKKGNPNGKWANLLIRALKKELKPLAGKRFANLVD